MSRREREARIAEIRVRYADCTPADISVLLAEIDDLAEDALELAALEDAGVDNWEGYSHAMDALREWREEGEA